MLPASVRLFASTALVTLGVSLSVSTEPARSAQSPSSIDDFFGEFTDEWIRADPNQAVRNQYFDGDEQAALSRQLTPVTAEWARERIQRARRGLDELASFDRDQMTEAQRRSAEVMQYQLQALIDSEPFLDYDFPLQQMNGANVRLPNALAVVHPVRSERDAVDYLARLRQVDDRMAEATAESERLATRGTLPPRFILEATSAQMRRFVDPPPLENPLVTSLVTKMEAVSEISPERLAAIRQEAAEIVELEVYPAWQSGISVLESQMSDASDDAGLWRFEDGVERYAQRLHFYTTTDLTAEEIHQIGLDEVRRIESEMDVLLRSLGYVEGSITDRVAALQADLAYPVTDEGRASIMAEINAILDDAQQRTAALFDVRPESEVVARPYPEFRWENAAASYSAPPADGSRPAVFQMPLRASRMTEFSLRSLVYHETVPGHHFQIALSIENPDLPAFRRLSVLGGVSASAEGWALYAERLAAEEGWYSDDPEGRLGQLNSALFRARRLVVDTGLHAMGWTRQQAIDFGIEASEVERYVVFPGQACSYMIGQLKIVELRERARAAIGDAFSVREFHNIVLSAGIVPLAILEQVVDSYISVAGGEQLQR